MVHELPVTHLKGVGAKLAEKLAALGIYTIQQLLFHLPNRYLDRTRVTPIAALQPNIYVVVEAEVRAADVVFGRRRSLVCRVQDTSGTLTLRFYHFSHAQKQGLSTGTRVRCYGETRRGSSGLEMYHPEYTFLDAVKAEALPETLTPIYPTTDGLSQPRLRGLIHQSLAHLAESEIVELLPAIIRRDLDQVTLTKALQLLHEPPATIDIDALAAGTHPYQQRLAFDELLAHQLSLLQFRAEMQKKQAWSLVDNQQLQQALMAQLGFTLTQAQKKVTAELCEDLAKTVPMLRLVQGDVGSGKTIVAALAALTSIASGKQVALMAPTEILAEQHKANFEAWFTPLGIKLGYLTGKLKAKDRREQLAAIADGTALMVVGTHALFQDEVNFDGLALVIIDEQHRFGVQQRLALSEKGAVQGGSPHQLIMTATPIPRTLMMSAYADLDYSVIDELPPGRTPVTTVVISNERRDEIIRRVSVACAEGKQAYWVCTLIDASEALTAQAAEVLLAALQVSLPQLRIALVHGRLKSAEKEAVMAAFKAGDSDLLVATTVIEVGVDIPNASLMIIENPERLGLSQLHQLRGRVGRGCTASHCVLLYGSPLSQGSRRRLQVLRESTDGFYIAEQDLAIRGPGEVLGTRQAGQMEFKIADIQRDANLLPAVRNAAQLMIRHHETSAKQISQRWLGGRERYFGV